jgi:rare lipoprotein A (peptidoglycan hydrolase)
MKKLIIVCLLFAGVCILSFAAREEGVAVCYNEEGDDGSYATHKTHPFGTKLVITNPVNKSQATVQIGGRPNPVMNATVEISQQTAERLGIYRDIPTWVWVEVVPPPATAAKHVMRPRMGVFKQSGNATALAAGNELTASHTSLPIGTKLKVTNSSNSRNVVITVTNRIRASTERIIEVSRAAAQALGIRTAGPVQIETVDN